MKLGNSVCRIQFLCSVMLMFLLLVGGCGEESSKTSLHDHEHEIPAHTPRSLADLGKKIRARVAIVGQSPDDKEAVAELNDLISWSAEIAADTNIGEARWIPIYELSESIRISIEDDAAEWGTQRCDKAIRLCQLTEDAWRSLSPDDRRERYLGHDHDHDHDHKHDHDDHDHDDHGHSHSEDGHAHGHSDNDHGHSHEEHRHSHGEDDQDQHSHDDDDDDHESKEQR